MRFKMLWLAVMVGALFLGIPGHGVCSEAQKHPVTVTLTDGRVFSDVFLTVDKSFSTITAKNLSTKETHVISFHEVKKIEDENGLNVTSKYLGNYKPPATTPQTQPDVQSPDSGRRTEDAAGTGRAAEPATKPQSDSPWLSEKSEKAMKWNQKPWNVRMRAGTIVEVPFGDWYEGLGTGVGFEVAAEVMLTSDASLRATFSHTSLEVNEAFLVLPPIGDYYFGDPDIDASIEKIMLWLVYTKQTSENISLFATGGIGATKHNADGSVPVTNIMTMETEDLPVSSDETELTLGSGFGVVYWVAEHFGIELGADFSVIYGTLEDVDGVSYGYLFSPKLGLTAAF